MRTLLLVLLLVLSALDAHAATKDKKVARAIKSLERSAERCERSCGSDPDSCQRYIDQMSGYLEALRESAPNDAEVEALKKRQEACVSVNEEQKAKQAESARKQAVYQEFRPQLLELQRQAQKALNVLARGRKKEAETNAHQLITQYDAGRSAVDELAKKCTGEFKSSGFLDIEFDDSATEVCELVAERAQWLREAVTLTANRHVDDALEEMESITAGLREHGRMKAANGDKIVKFDFLVDEAWSSIAKLYDWLGAEPPLASKSRLDEASKKLAAAYLHALKKNSWNSPSAPSDLEKNARALEGIEPTTRVIAVGLDGPPQWHVHRNHAGVVQYRSILVDSLLQKKTGRDCRIQTLELFELFDGASYQLSKVRQKPDYRPVACPAPSGK